MYDVGVSEISQEPFIHVWLFFSRENEDQPWDVEIHEFNTGGCPEI